MDYVNFFLACLKNVQFLQVLKQILNNLENERVKCIVIKEINGMSVFNSGFQYLK